MNDIRIKTQENLKIMLLAFIAWHLETIGKQFGFEVKQPLEGGLTQEIQRSAAASRLAFPDLKGRKFPKDGAQTEKEWKPWHKVVI